VRAPAVAVAVAFALAACFAAGFLAGRWSADPRPPSRAARPESVDAQPGREPGAATAPRADVPAGTAARDPDSALAAMRERRRREYPEPEWSAAALVAELTAAAKVEDAVLRQRRCERILRRLALVATTETYDALLAMFRDGTAPIDRLGEAWIDVLAEVDDARVGPVLRAFLERRVAAREHRSSADTALLWQRAIRAMGPEADATIVAVLGDPSLAANATLKTALLAGIPEGERSAAVRTAVAAVLDDRDAHLDAFRALVRMGDAASHALAFEHLLRSPDHTAALAACLGPSLTAEDFAQLRAEAERSVRAAVAYAAAASSAPPERAAAEAALLRTSLPQTLARLPDGERILRTNVAHAALALAETLADPALADALRAEAARTEVAREPLLRAARAMERALAR
jgi:hypothetical protein